MSEVEVAEFDLDDASNDEDLLVTLSAKDSKAQQKLEARRRIDDLLEQKRLRSLLDDWDLDDE
ncbi:PA3496 family putative envelope integrity protein [Rheinheimera sp. WS51]|uniref:PA3496 family putative envelope integrity protein n=1 Tax=Rheinheimera sp. WS51 TaxID=3425886 RepID=UPI003D90CDD5